VNIYSHKVKTSTVLKATGQVLSRRMPGPINCQC